MKLIKKKTEKADCQEPLVAEASDGAVATAEPKKKHRRVRWLVIGAVVVIAGVFIVPKLLGGSAPASAAYRAESVSRRDLSQRITGTATLQPTDSYNVTTLVSGEVLDAPFEEGAQVNKGDLLFSIDSSLAQNTVSAAALSVQQSRNTYAQAKEALYPSATLSGIISDVYVHDGQSVTAGQQLCRIVSNADLKVDLLFTYDAAKSFYIGQSASLFISGFAGIVTGTVDAISDSSTLSSAGTTVRSVRVKIKNPGNIPDNSTAQASIGGIGSYGTATINMAGAATVFATGSGTVANFSKLSGSSVAKGDTLCTIESESNRTMLKNAELSLKASELTQSTAQTSMDGYTITAPISGQIIQKKIKAGDKVDGATTGTLAMIYDLTYLKMEMPVNELDIVNVQPGQQVECVADALPGEIFEGTVEKVSISGTTSNGFTTYPVTIVIRDYGALKPGMNVSTTILVGTAANALCVPLDAVSRANTVLLAQEGALAADGVTVVDPSKTEDRAVTIGRNNDQYIEITSGLEEGDIVLVPDQPASAPGSDSMGG